jgi:hypothetical protein
MWRSEFDKLGAALERAEFCHGGIAKKLDELHRKWLKARTRFE